MNTDVSLLDQFCSGPLSRSGAGFTVEIRPAGVMDFHASHGAVRQKLQNRSARGSQDSLPAKRQPKVKAAG
jgi:hypothetical protein